MNDTAPLKHLFPGWFAIPMGWAGLALAWHRAAPLMGETAQGVTLIAAGVAALVFVLIGAATLLRWQRHAQALREGGASAGSEPVAGAVLDDEGAVCLIRRGTEREYIARRGGSLLYTHPSPPEGMVGVWTALPGALPEPGVPVLLDIGKKYPIRALWAAKHTVEAADDDTDWAEYDEATETYYCPEGWYEWNEFEETHWAVNETPGAWAPLPPTNPAGSGKGE